MTQLTAAYRTSFGCPQGPVTLQDHSLSSPSTHSSHSRKISADLSAAQGRKPESCWHISSLLHVCHPNLSPPLTKCFLMFSLFCLACFNLRSGYANFLPRLQLNPTFSLMRCHDIFQTLESSCDLVFRMQFLLFSLMWLLPAFLTLPAGLFFVCFTKAAQ